MLPHFRPFCIRYSLSVTLLALWSHLVHNYTYVLIITISMFYCFYAIHKVLLDLDLVHHQHIWAHSTEHYCILTLIFK